MIFFLSKIEDWIILCGTLQVLESQTCFYRSHPTLIWLFCFQLCFGWFSNIRSVLRRWFQFLNSKTNKAVCKSFKKSTPFYPWHFSRAESQGIASLCPSAWSLLQKCWQLNSNELIYSSWNSKLISEDKSKTTIVIVFWDDL